MGFAVDNATLNRFFAIHFLLPFVIVAFVILHLLFLHQRGSNNPLGLNSNLTKVSFHCSYAILRSISRKLGGVVAIFSALLILFFIPILNSSYSKVGFSFYPVNQVIF